MRRRRLKTAFILGAGLGTRLRPLTDRCPKPLLPVGGRPVITYAMDHLITAGVDRFIVNTHLHHEMYEEKFPDGRWRGVPVSFRRESVLLDTAGGLKNIEDLLDEDDAILCYNGDVIAGFSLGPLCAWHERLRPEATLALRSSGRPLNVSIDEEGAVCDMRGALGAPAARNCLFTGIYAVETSILRFIEAGRPESIVPILLGRIAASPGAVRGVVIDEGEWHDMGDIATYERLCETPPGAPADKAAL